MYFIAVPTRIRNSLADHRGWVGILFLVQPRGITHEELSWLCARTFSVVLLHSDWGPKGNPAGHSPPCCRSLVGSCSSKAISDIRSSTSKNYDREASLPQGMRFDDGEFASIC
ncbi:hypothetical protein CIHG_06097 [Coccidioides immitis H538.4]|uniref:Uncharacterized protein n=3 Tax=Coccidioides immitis TaxID=5501 RepID=A0A0J8RAL8_COCIT|nr:hypothetical protein CIRG_00037 [Coccidioides immitis RMSCC 2394]KMU82134.1 hypothetical protein CISG_09570 [Coccidioides immitis RMSCC 3703]KMU88299.1 hypothetical protein CIHG_06097 [Coccidioides immitis H538.4]